MKQLKASSWPGSVTAAAPVSRGATSNSRIHLRFSLAAVGSTEGLDALGEFESDLKFKVLACDWLDSARRY